MRRPSLLVVAAALAVGLLTVPVQPAGADTGTCWGFTGRMHTGAPLNLGPGGVLTTFSMSLSGGICAGITAPQLDGQISGNCHAAGGIGTTSTGHTFFLSWIGDTMIFVEDDAPGMEGGVILHPDVSAGQSCLAGATTFLIVAGALRLWH